MRITRRGYVVLFSLAALVGGTAQHWSPWAYGL